MCFIVYAFYYAKFVPTKKVQGNFTTALYLTLWKTHIIEVTFVIRIYSFTSPTQPQFLLLGLGLPFASLQRNRNPRQFQVSYARLSKTLMACQMPVPRRERCSFEHPLFDRCTRRQPLLAVPLCGNCCTPSLEVSSRPNSFLREMYSD